MIKTLRQQIIKGGHSDNFIQIAGNITHFIKGGHSDNFISIAGNITHFIKGGHSDNFIPIAGKITHFTAPITEAPHTSSITPGIACLLNTAVPCVDGR
jgi:hypothetical protein